MNKCQGCGYVPYPPRLGMSHVLFDFYSVLRAAVVPETPCGVRTSTFYFRTVVPTSLWLILQPYCRISRVGCTASFACRAMHASNHVDPQDTPRPYFIRLNLTQRPQECPARCQILLKSCLCHQKIIPLQDLESVAGAIRWQGARRIQSHQDFIPRRTEHETRGETSSLYAFTSTILSLSTVSPPYRARSTGSPILYKMPFFLSPLSPLSLSFLHSRSSGSLNLPGQLA